MMYKCQRSLARGLSLVRLSGLSGVGEEVKVHEIQCKTKWSVLGGRGWGESGDTKGGSIIVPLTSCLTGLD
jgi:hypothetical protein